MNHAGQLVQAGQFAGVTFIADTLRPGARQALAELKASGVKRIVMLTGDNAATAQVVADELGIDEVRADLMPEDKVAAITELQAQGHRVAMVGDGVNDAPHWRRPMWASRWAAAARKPHLKRPTSR